MTNQKNLIDRVTRGDEDAFAQPVVLEKAFESPFDCMEIQPVHPKGNQS